MANARPASRPLPAERLPSADVALTILGMATFSTFLPSSRCTPQTPREPAGKARSFGINRFLIKTVPPAALRVRRFRSSLEKSFRVLDRQRA